MVLVGDNTYFFLYLWQVQGRDNVMIPGLSMSVGSHIKSIIESDVDIYSKKDDKEKYFIW
jgi:hypothetical protein